MRACHNPRIWKPEACESWHLSRLIARSHCLASAKALSTAWRRYQIEELFRARALLK